MEILRKNQFKKDFKKAQKQGKDIEKLKRVINQLVSGQTLEKKYLDHPLEVIGLIQESVTLNQIGY